MLDTDYESAFDVIDSLYDDEDYDEARRRPSRPIRRPITPVGRSNYFQQRTPPRPATENQVKQALEKVKADIARLDTRTQQLTTGLADVVSITKQQAQTLKDLKSEMDQSKQLFLLTSLMGGGTKTLTIESAQAADGKAIPEMANATVKAKDKSDKMDKLLPVFLLGGIGGSPNRNPGGLGIDPLTLILLLEGMGG